jgi:hypothetical protein
VVGKGVSLESKQHLIKPTDIIVKGGHGDNHHQHSNVGNNSCLDVEVGNDDSLVSCNHGVL